ncbi:MAG: hypothetical protein ACK5QQ_06290, partial [Cyanobacteriota bacterium]
HWQRIKNILTTPPAPLHVIDQSKPKSSIGTMFGREIFVDQDFNQWTTLALTDQSHAMAQECLPKDFAIVAKEYCQVDCPQVFAAVVARSQQE